jgi:glycine oxidase
VHVIVVGAGVVGCAIAHELAARGAEVQALDLRGVGQGATRASAGMLAPYIEGHAAPLLRLGICSLEQYDAFVRRVSADARRPIEYRRTGTLEVVRAGEDVTALTRQQVTLAELGTRADVLDGAEVRRLEPALAGDVHAALRVPAQGYVRASALTDALAAAAAARGARLSVAHVERIDRTSGGVTVETTEGTLMADAVVLAAGSWSGGIPMARAAAAPVRPVRGQLVQLRPAQPLLAHIVWGSDCYLVPWQDGRVLVGATVEDVGFDERVTEEAVGQLRASGERLVPALARASLDEARAGLRPATADELPIIGPSATMPGVFYATGHYRNGVLLAPLTASLIADLVLGGRERPELNLVRPDRFGL